MIPNMTVPLHGTGLFNLQTTVWSQDLDFDLKIENVHAPPTVEKVTDHFFRLAGRVLFEISIDFLSLQFEESTTRSDFASHASS